MNIHASGFTLIEILIVIAIVSLLAAILFPVFSRARENARRSACQSNLKQHGLAILQYAQDYDERLPWSQMDYPAVPTGGAWTTHPTAGYNWWFWPQITYPYHRSQGIFTCTSIGLYRTQPYRGHYGANERLMPLRSQALGVGTTDPVMLSQMAAPATLYLAFDAGTSIISVSNVRSASNSQSYLPGSGVIPGYPGAITNTSLEQDFRTGRHFGGVNMAFADGHVKWVKSEAVVAQANKSNFGSFHEANS